MFYTVWRFRSCSSSRSSLLLSRCVPFIVGRPVLPSVMHCLDHSLEVRFLDKLFSPVVVQRQVPFLSGLCAALPVETPQVQFLDEVLGHLRQMPWSRQSRSSTSYCGAETVPRCPCVIPQLLFLGGRFPCCGDATGCLLPVVIPQVRLLDRSVMPVW